MPFIYLYVCLSVVVRFIYMCQTLVCDLQLRNVMWMLQTPASPPSTMLEPKSPLPGTRERKGTDGWDAEEWGNLEEDPVRDTWSCISIVHKEDKLFSSSHNFNRLKSTALCCSISA